MKERNHGMQDPIKIPKMSKAEYDSLIERQHVSRIAFAAAEYPYIAPFMYVFDGKYLYFLSTKYGRKIEYFKNNPRVSVEIEEYAPDLSAFTFVSLQGFFRGGPRPLSEEESAQTLCGYDEGQGALIPCIDCLGHSPQ